MAILDDQGRLFGRVNLVDAAAGVLVLALIPLGYIAWMLFSTPPPVVESVSPAVVSAGQANQRVELRGRRLRPFLRADVGEAPATYVFRSPERAEVVLPPLSPGTYDLSFFDAREIARFPKVVTVKPDTVVEIQIRFVTRPEILEMVKRSRALSTTEPPSRPSGPTLVSYEVIDDLVGTTKPDLREGRVSVIRAIVRLAASWTPDGWYAAGGPLKAGQPFILTAPTYVLRGDIISVEIPNAAQ
jgi:hypothetical protein